MEAKYYGLTAGYPETPNTNSKQWLHDSCEGTIQIGENGKLRCQKCHIEQHIFTWNLAENFHVSHTASGKCIELVEAISFGGQIAPTAGIMWLKTYLINIGAEKEANAIPGVASKERDKRHDKDDAPENQPPQENKPQNGGPRYDNMHN